MRRMKMWCISIPAALLMVMLTFLACVPRTSTISVPSSADTPIPGLTDQLAPAKPAWEIEWDRLVDTAKKEGRLVVVGGAVGSDVRVGLTGAFKDKFGIETEFISGRGAEQTEKVLRERRAGIFGNDVYIGGATTPTIQLKPEGVVDSLEGVIFLPDVVDDKRWQGGLYYDKQHMIAAGFGTVKPIIYVNPEHVKPGEVKALKDILDPKWKGKIVINDPTTAGTGKDTMVTIMMLMGVDYIKSLVVQNPIVTRDQRLQAEWVVKGKYPIAIGAADSVVMEFTRSGAVVNQVVPTEGTHVSTGIGAVSLINRAPHPNAARIFINWILTRDTQSLFARLSDHASRRVDVANDHLDQNRKPQPGMRYIIQDEEIQLRAEEHMKLFKEIFKSVM